MKKVILGLAMSLLTVNANAALIEIYESNSSIGSIAQAEAVIASSGGADTTAYSDTIWFSDYGTHGAPTFPGGHTSTFVMTATGSIDTSSYSHLWVAHDDGIEMSIEDSVIYDWDGNTDYRNSGALYLGANEGVKDFDLLFWEQGGAADIFLWGMDRATGSWEVAQIGTVDVPEPGSMALFGLGLVGLGFARRKAKA